MSAHVQLPSGYTLSACDTIDSTNEQAKRLAAEGAPQGTVVWARRQTAGRGRRGRAWISEPGNLYASVLLRPRCPPAQALQISFVAANAMTAAAAELIGPRVLVKAKWPNDVLAGGRKVAGILLESSPGASGSLAWLIAGIGLNIAHHPPATEYPATSLAAEGAGAVTVEAALGAVLRHFALGLDLWQKAGFEPVRQIWLSHAAALGERITVRLFNETLEGTFAGLDEAGALILQTGAERRRITAGDVFPAAA